MLDTLNATQMAFLQIAALQAVAAALWGLGAWHVQVVRPALAHWATYAALASATWLGLAINMRAPPLVTALGGVAAALMLRRGIRLFVGSNIDWREAPLALGVVAAAAALPYGGDWRPVQAVLNFGVLAAIYLGTALDLWRHARQNLGWRYPLLLALPALLGAGAFVSRSALALMQPGAVLTEMTQHSTLNVGSALLYIVLVMMLHATLLVLVLSRLFGELQQLAQRDPLTGLLNRRELHAVLDRQAQSGRRAGDTFSVLMIDLDHFKAINDRLGHEAGDSALAHVAQLITRSLREQDRVGRIGGEEFAAWLPGIGLDDALALAERLRHAVSAAPLGHVGEDGRLTVSIGVAQWAGAGETPVRLLARADAALYRAKGMGRNRVEAAAPA